MLRVIVKKRTSSQIQAHYLRINEIEYPKDYDFYELVAAKLKWKGRKNEDALWFLSRNNYINIEKVEDEDNLL